MTVQDNSYKVYTDEQLVELISGISGPDESVTTVLRTDERVIARVTDGIYRQPASAIRELISNAYDADATRIIIKTDAPRFNRISVDDDGRGMSPAVLTHLLHHIGGSAKRMESGSALGITQSSDPLMSPGGRRLIGKIGIGLFSVSQLTHAFQIVTKVENDEYRTVATVVLRQYSDSGDNSGGNDADFESGRVRIWREPALDKRFHGTSIILTSIRPQAKDTLMSSDIWAAIEKNEEIEERESRGLITPPLFHIGRISSEPGDKLRASGTGYYSVPWDDNDLPDQAFPKLVDAVWVQLEKTNPNPRLDQIFDYYLRMLWQLALAVPLPYVHGTVYDLSKTDITAAFAISNSPKGSAMRIDFGDGSTLGDARPDLRPKQSVGQFDVYVDEIKLNRPLRYTYLPHTSHAIDKPLVFIGHCRETFPSIAPELSGGPLEFDAYLFWNPKIAPTEHRGALIRINESSGTLFDPTFMRYQVAELTRLAQITCEIFVSEGLDGALNIDRESFNYAHPHSVFITKWLHSALRQVATTQKKVADEIRERQRANETQVASSEIDQIVNKVWIRETDDLSSPPPPVIINDSGVKSVTAGAADAYVYPRSKVLSPSKAKRNTKGNRSRQLLFETKVKAIVQVLASFGVLENIPLGKQEQLIRAISDIISATGEP